MSQPAPTLPPQSDSQPNYPSPYTIWRIAASVGPVWLISFLILWVFGARFLPPPAESWSTQQVFEFYTEHNTGLRIAMTGIVFLAPLYTVWTISVTRVIRWIEGPNGLLGYIELVGGIMTTLVISAISLFWLTAAFRIKARSPETVQTLHDLGWITFNLTVGMTIVQMVSFGVAMLIDRRAKPMYPSWLGWLSFLTSTTFLFALAVPFVMHGPVAWNGLLTFYFALGLFFPWALLCMFYTYRSIGRIEQEAAAGQPVSLNH
jgi:hypothetical protein